MKVGKPVRKLSVVGMQQRSPATPGAVTPVVPAETALQKNQRQMAEIAAERRRKQDAGLLKGQATRAEQAAKGVAARARGERSRLEKYRAGEYPCSSWDDKEISKGKPRGLDGGFTGGYPSLTGRQHAEIKRELLKRGQRQMDESLGLALKTLAQIAQYGESESARVKAATILMERAAGKVPDKIELKSSDPWQDILDEVMDDEVLQRMGVDVPADAENAGDSA